MEIIIEIIKDIWQHWTRKRGLAFAIVLEYIILFLFWNKTELKGIKASLGTGLGTGWVIGLVLALFTFVIWLITTKRILFRSVRLVILWLFIAIAITTGFYWIGYPLFINGGVLDLPYIRIWGCSLLFLATLIIGLFIDCRVLKGNKLLIVFAVNNESVAVEKTIRSSIDPVVNAIQDADSNVRLVVLPFGNLKSIRSCVKYINFPLTRADAIIFASVIDDSDSSPVGYVFTSFSSRINEKRFVEDERKASIHNAILDAHTRCKEWNYLNSANDNCSRKVAISRNLEDMLRMYIGCMYLMKHDFKAALPYTNNAIYTENRNSPSYAIASSLYSYAMLSAAQELENNDRDYDAALEQLTELVSTLPVNNNDPGYNKAMARLMFYKGKMKLSEEYTRKFRDLPNHRWGYELNMGFYAINRKKVLEFVQQNHILLSKKKVLEFVQRYKNLRKYYPCEELEPVSAIKFLQYQLENTDDSDYGVLLKIAIAYLHLYISPQKAKKLIKNVRFESENIKLVKAIDEIRVMVNTTTKRRDATPRKK